MKVNDIIGSLYSMSEDDVRKINAATYDILNGKRKARNKDAKSKLRVGMRVTFTGKYGAPETGTIKRVNRTRCVVDTGGFRTWTVPMTMLKPV